MPISPAEALRKTTPGQRAGIAIAAAVLVAAPLAQRWEGYSGKAYLDPVKVLTQCYGETENIDPSKIYSKDECAVKLRARMARDYAPVLAKCMPAFVGEDWQRYTSVFGALLDASYNAGPQRTCNRFAPVVNAGGLERACNALPTWMITARDRKTGVRKVYRGLINRRNDERKTCLAGVA